MKLHLGCGNAILKGWVNIDLYNKKADIIDNVITLSKYKDNTIDELYTSHLVEHLFPANFQKALLRWYKVLKIGGSLVIRCPDGGLWLNVWLKASDEERFNNPRLRDSVLGTLRKGCYNYNLFSKGLLVKYLEKAGFKNIECRLVSSRSPRLKDILMSGGKDEGKDYTGYPKRDIWCEAIKK